MGKQMQEQSETKITGTAPAQRSSRRGFMVTGAAAIVAAGVWSLRKSSLASVVAASAGSAAPGPVTVVAFSAAGAPTGKVTVPRVIKTEEQWKQQLSPVSFEVTRKAGTERAYSGDSWNLHDRGLFRCICCGNALFSSETKFDSGTGWPSFWQPIAKENVVEIRDSTPSGWIVPPSHAANAMPTSVTSLTMVPIRPGSATA
jgi:peptide-methionine (R)-S-oxide reductase